MSSERKYVCSDCDKEFSTLFNLNRHQRKFHDSNQTSDSDCMETSGSNSKETSDNESEETSENESGRESEEGSEEHTDEDSDSQTSCENSDGEDSEVNNPFESMVNEIVIFYEKKLEEIMTGLIDDNVHEHKAFNIAYNQLLPNFRKSLQNLFVDYLLQIEDMKAHPVYKAIMKKVRHFESDGYEREEAVKAAVDARKYLFDRLLPKEVFIRSNIDEDMDC